MIKNEIEKYIKSVFPNGEVFDKQIDPLHGEISLKINNFISARTYWYEDVHHNTLSISNLALDLTRAMCVNLIRNVK